MLVSRASCAFPGFPAEPVHAARAQVIQMFKNAGFEAVYLGGYAHTASNLGLPDAGLATFPEMLQRVHNLVRSVRIPVLADGDTGYGNALNVRRTVQEYEWAGAQAIQLEDQEMPKKCGHTPGKRLVDAIAQAPVAAHAEVAQVYRNPSEWWRRSILNVAHMGRFSSDLTIAAYAKEIWGVPVHNAG